MAMKRVSTIFRSPSSSAGPSSGEKLPVVVQEDDDSVSIETIDAKSQQTTVATLPPPNLKIKVRPTRIRCLRELITLPVHSASIIITRDGEVGSTRTLDPRSSQNRGRSWLTANSGLDTVSS